MASKIFGDEFDKATGINIPSRMSFAQKVREIRKRARLTQTEFAKAIGVAQGTVSRWESMTRGQIPEVDAIMRVSAYSGVSTSELWADEHEFQPYDWGYNARVIGNVQAGQWVEAVAWEEPDQFSVKIPLPRNWPDNLKVEGFVVRGTSMDQLYPEGSVVFAIGTIANQIDPSPGDRVIVTREDRNGLFEVTIKEYVLDGSGRPWLWPKSTDPAFQTPLSLIGSSDSKIVQVTVTGIVVAAFALDRPYRFVRAATDF